MRTWRSDRPPARRYAAGGLDTGSPQKKNRNCFPFGSGTLSCRCFADDVMEGRERPKLRFPMALAVLSEKMTPPNGPYRVFIGRHDKYIVPKNRASVGTGTGLRGKRFGLRDGWGALGKSISFGRLTASRG